MESHKSFWIKNITKRAVSIGDLGIYLLPYQMVNLLNHKSYPYITIDIIKDSLNGGALGKFSNKIVVCKVPPQLGLKTSSPIDVNLSAIAPTKIRSIIKHKEEFYKELELSDDEYANQNFDIANEDADKYKKV